MTTETWTTLNMLREAIDLLSQMIPQVGFNESEDAVAFNKKMDDVRHYLDQCPIQREYI